MIDVYVRQSEKPEKCRECPFLNSYDECVLQSEEANFYADGFDTLFEGCPLLTFETEAECFVEREKMKNE